MWVSVIPIVISVISLILLLVLVLRKDLGAGLRSEIIRLDEKLQGLNSLIGKTEQAIRDEARFNRQEIAQSLKNLSDSSEQKLENMRQTITNHLQAIQRSNEEKLEQMRATVDEKLQSTLEKRLSESFNQVSERLESVHKGLGEMQKLASEVGNLKNVLSNIKTRGTLGEIQLEKILEQTLTPSQYEKNAKINGKIVEFAIKLPGKDEEEVLLPIDSKFPIRTYEELLDAQEKSSCELVEELSKRLENEIKLQARDISDKYIAPPKTTDFAIMFLPIEGLFAEVLRRPGLFQSLQSQYKIMVTGPTTFNAILTSLQMGFKTLAIEKQASEVWNLLAAVKTDFGKFTETLEGVKRNLTAASNKIEEAEKRTRIIGKKLKDVQALPAQQAEGILGPAEDIEDEPRETE